MYPTRSHGPMYNLIPQMVTNQFFTHSGKHFAPPIPFLHSTHLRGVETDVPIENGGKNIVDYLIEFLIRCLQFAILFYWEGAGERATDPSFDLPLLSGIPALLVMFLHPLPNSESDAIWPSSPHPHTTRLCS